LNSLLIAPTLLCLRIWRETGKAFAYGVEDRNIKIQLLLEGKKTVNEVLRQALELQAILLAGRPHKNSTKMCWGSQSPPTKQRAAKQSGCFICGESSHFEGYCPYGIKA
jgi:hypothetical protein